ncbi:MAG: hypothetical protein HC859_09210 [Bacteroidia bacterium]|nr:hypothetical protein [Bacteroidia bacterium]
MLLPSRIVRGHHLACRRAAYAQDKTSEVDKIFSWATPATPGCVCAVSQNGKLVVNRAYGLADLERVLDVPVLGVIPASRYNVSSNEFHISDHPKSMVSEAMRTLRTNLDFSISARCAK